MYDVCIMLCVSFYSQSFHACMCADTLCGWFFLLQSVFSCMYVCWHPLRLILSFTVSLFMHVCVLTPFAADSFFYSQSFHACMCADTLCGWFFLLQSVFSCMYVCWHPLRLILSFTVSLFMHVCVLTPFAADSFQVYFCFCCLTSTPLRGHTSGETHLTCVLLLLNI